MGQIHVKLMSMYDLSCSKDASLPMMSVNQDKKLACMGLKVSQTNLITYHNWSYI